MIQQFLLGLTFPLRGFKIIFSSKLLMAIAAVPFLIVSGIFWSGIGMVSPLIDGWSAGAMTYIFSGSEGFLYNLLYYPLMAIFWVVFLITFGMLVYLLTSVFASPFNGLLAERVLIQNGVVADEPLHLGRMLINAINMLKISILRAVVLIFVGGILFLTSFIPVVHLVSAFLAFILVAFDVADYSMEAQKLTLRQRFNFLDRYRVVFVGMGAAVGALALVPGLLLLAMPFMVAGFADMTSVLKGR